MRVMTISQHSPNQYSLFQVYWATEQSVPINMLNLARSSNESHFNSSPLCSPDFSRVLDRSPGTAYRGSYALLTFTLCSVHFAVLKHHLFRSDIALNCEEQKCGAIIIKCSRSFVQNSIWREINILISKLVWLRRSFVCPWILVLH